MREAGHSLSPAYRRVCACGHELAGPSLTTDQVSRASATSGVRSLAVWDLQTYLRVSSSAAVKVVVARIQRWRFMNFSGLGCFLRLVACELKRLRRCRLPSQWAWCWGASLPNGNDGGQQRQTASGWVAWPVVTGKRPLAGVSAVGKFGSRVCGCLWTSLRVRRRHSPAKRVWCWCLVPSTPLEEHVEQWLLMRREGKLGLPRCAALRSMGLRARLLLTATGGAVVARLRFRDPRACASGVVGTAAAEVHGVASEQAATGRLVTLRCDVAEAATLAVGRAA